MFFNQGTGCVQSPSRMPTSPCRQIVGLGWRDIRVYLPSFWAMQCTMNFYHAFLSSNGSGPFSIYLVMHQSRKYLLSQVKEMAQVLESLDFTVNQQKLNLTPVQELRSLGFVVDSKLLKFIRKSRISGRRFKY